MDDYPGTATITEPAPLKVPSCSDAAMVAAWCRGKGAAGLAAALQFFTGPATVLFGWIAETEGHPAEITVSVWDRADRAATAAECAFLQAPAGTRVLERHATMRAGCLVGGSGLTEVLAEVESVVVPARMPDGAMTSLEGETSLGAIIAEHGWREPLGAVPWMGGVSSTARMWIGNQRVASASEQTMPWVCRMLDREPATGLGPVTCPLQGGRSA